MTRCPECGTPIDEADDCPSCERDRAASLREYLSHGGFHPALRPLEPGTPWKSREELMGEFDPDV